MDYTCKNILNVLKLFDVMDAIDGTLEFERFDSLPLRLTEDYFGFFDEEVINEENVPHRILRDMLNPMETYTNEEFKIKYSFSKESILCILELIIHGLQRSNNRGKPISPLLELLITIRFMITGSLQSIKDDVRGISHSTISRLILKVSLLLSELHRTHIIYPKQSQIKTLMQKFYENSLLPNVVGCLGTTYVSIKNPGGSTGEDYLNEYGYYSLKVQITSGPELEFLDIVANSPGSMPNSKIFNKSGINHHLNSMDTDCYLVANSAYPPMKHVLTPVELPTSSQEMKYNKAIEDLYNIPKTVEIWKKRFRCLTTLLANKEETCHAIIQATAVLHNLAVKYKEELPEASMLKPISEMKTKVLKSSIPVNEVLYSDPAAVNARGKYIKTNFN